LIISPAILKMRKGEGKLLGRSFVVVRSSKALMFLPR
jgi:hypothetical protein